MVRQPDDWRQYEQVAAHTLNDLAARFGFKQVEGKQSIAGLRSGTEWVQSQSRQRARRDHPPVCPDASGQGDRMRVEDGGPEV
jgi:hypothetical protein